MYRNRFRENDEFKRKIDEYKPLSPDAVLQIRNYYKIGLTYSSNGIEGNTLDLAETKVVLEDGLTIGGKPLRDHLEAIGHAEAFDAIFGLVGATSITEDDIKYLHKLFYRGINAETAGKYRTKPIIVTGADVDFPAPETIEPKMREFAEKIPEMQKNLHPVEFAAMLHLIFVNIHPFIDGNGRVARLLMNLALLRGGYNITIIPPVLRADYIRALQASNHNDFEPFVNFVSEAVWESQKEYLRILERLK